MSVAERAGAASASEYRDGPACEECGGITRVHPTLASMCPRCIDREDALGSSRRSISAHRDAVGSSWQPVNLSPIFLGAGDHDRPDILTREDGESLLYSGKTNSIYGETESGKTWLVLKAVAQELLAGKVVGYIDYEDSARGAVGRLRTLGVPDEVIGARFIYIQPSEAVATASAEIEALLARNPSLVAIDGVTEGMTVEGLSLNDNADVARFHERLPRRIARRGTAVTLVDHVVKSRDDRGRYPIGAQSKLSGVDGAAYSVKLKTPFGRGRTGRAQLYLTKDRPGWVPSEGKKRLVAEIEAVSQGDRMDIALKSPVSSGELRPTVLMERISRALEADSEGRSEYWVRQNVHGSTDGKRLALEVLVREGFVVVEPGSRNAHLHRSVRAYREKADLSGDRSPSGQNSDMSDEVGDPDLSSVPPRGGGASRTGQVEGSHLSPRTGQVQVRTGERSPPSDKAGGELPSGASEQLVRGAI